MNDMIIRVTKSKREVGILKTSPQLKQALPTNNRNVGKDPENMHDKNICLNRCFGKLRDFNGEFPSDKETTSKPDGDDKKDTVQDLALNKNTEIGAQSPNHRVEPMPEQTPMELVDFDSELENKSKSTTKSKFKQMRNFTIERREGKLCFKPASSTRSDVNKFTKDTGNSDSSDEEQNQKHPNRRLQPERPEVDLPTKKPTRGYSCLIGKEEHRKPEVSLQKKRSTRGYSCLEDKEHERPEVDPSKRYTRRYSFLVGKEENQGVKRVKSTVVTVVNKQYCSDSTRKRPRGMTVTRVVEVLKEKTEIEKVGQDVSIIDSPHLSEGKPRSVNEENDDQTCSDGIDSAINYKTMLNEFLLQRQKENDRAKGKTLYEKRMEEMFRDANSSYMLKEFYISPALVELFNDNMVQGQAAVDSLRKVCKLKNWPDPTYTCVNSGKGYLYSCTLKTETFVPTKTATNEELAKELAALECLQWLGLEHKA